MPFRPLFIPRRHLPVGFGDTALGAFCPITPGQSDHPVAVLRMNLPAGDYLTMVALCYCAGVLFISQDGQRRVCLLACLLACFYACCFWLDSLLTHRRFCSLYRLIFFALSKDDRVSPTAPPLNHRGRTKLPRATMEAAFLESGTNVDKVRGESFVLGFGCFALHDQVRWPKFEMLKC